MLVLVAGQRPPFARLHIVQPHLHRARPRVAWTPPWEAVAPICQSLAVGRDLRSRQRHIVLHHTAEPACGDLQLDKRGVVRVVGRAVVEEPSVAAPAAGDFRLRVEGQLHGRAALNGDGENVPVAVAHAAEREPLAVGRPERVGVVGDMARNRRCATACAGRDPNIAAIHKRDLTAVGAKRGHPRADNRLRGRRRQLREGNQQHSTETEQHTNNAIHKHMR
jgi:hypothetical protein